MESQAFSGSTQLRGGAGRTRTNNQTVMGGGSSPTSSTTHSRARIPAFCGNARHRLRYSVRNRGLLILWEIVETQDTPYCEIVRAFWAILRPLNRARITTRLLSRKA